MAKNTSLIPVIIYDDSNSLALDRQILQSDCNCDCDTSDCACSTYITRHTILKNVDRSQLQVSPTKKIKIDEKHNLYYGAFNAHTVLNKAAEQILIDIANKNSDQINSINKIYLYELVKSGLVFSDSSMPTEAVTNNYSSNTLSAWLHITDQCNLRCSYCYLPHTKEDMTAETAQISIEKLFDSAKKHNYKRVKIKYAGGEPLLRFDLVKLCHEQAQKMALKYKIPFDETILTNSTLLNEEKAQQIKQMGMKVMISLDGLSQNHDNQRHYSDKSGSFQKVIAGINAAINAGIPPHISITVTELNAPNLFELVEWLLPLNLTFSLNFYRSNIYSQNLNDLYLREKIIIDGLLKAFAVLRETLPQWNMLSALGDRANFYQQHQHTCGVGRDYLVFTPQGHLAKCQMDIHNYLNPHDQKDPVQLIREDTLGIQNLPVNSKSECSKCEWKHWCTGGCPLMTRRIKNNYTAKSPNCNIYKAIFPEILRLEGLRLIKRYETEKFGA